MVLRPGAEVTAEAIFRKWGLDFAVIGSTTNTGRMIVRHQGRVEADIPVAQLAASAPVYERPWAPTPKPVEVAPASVPAPPSVLETLHAMLGGPDLSSRRWIWEQYDHMVMGDTIQRPGGDAAVVRVHGTSKAIAVSCDVTPRYVAADPEVGGQQAVVETWRNLTAVGADPLAITDNLNFASPERPEAMGQFVEAVRGIAIACGALSYPVVSGNVSLYNETNGVGILPTPAIGGVGLIPDLSKRADVALKRAGDVLVLIGRERGHLGQSLYQRHVTGRFEGAPPPVNFDEELKAGTFVRSLIRDAGVTTVHDVSDGGLLVTIAEMALAGNLGVDLDLHRQDLPEHAIWFGEDQGRYVVELPKEIVDDVITRAKADGLAARRLGTVGGDAIVVGPEPPLPLSLLRAAHEGWFPQFMDGSVPSI